MQRDPNIAAQRAVNTKEYLTVDHGIDSARIMVVTGGEGTQSVEDYLVPQGGLFNADVHGTTPVDETVVKPQERQPLPMRSHTAHKHAAAAMPAAATPSGTTKPAGARHHKRKSANRKRPARAKASSKDSTGP